MDDDLWRAAVAQPSWLGSDTLAISGAPRFNLRAPGAPKRFNAFDDGISPGFDVGMFRIGPNIAFVPERDPNSEADLNGLNRVDFTLEAGAFAEVYPVSWLRLRGAARYGFFGHEGINGNIGPTLSGSRPITGRWPPGRAPTSLIRPSPAPISAFRRRKARRPSAGLQPAGRALWRGAFGLRDLCLRQRVLHHWLCRL